jgi:beta-glucosidase/6-phospho-beta-glucosidase/beta-galactosidase
LDVAAESGHAHHVLADYARLPAVGIRVAREGLRWHVVERLAGRYDFSSAVAVLDAARSASVQVIWDLCHYGWPDDLDVFSPAFVRRFASLARAFTNLLSDQTDDPPFICPINEISFLSWAGGDVGYMHPFARDRGFELKAQLVRAAIGAVEAILGVAPAARILHVDPLIHVVSASSRSSEAEASEKFRRAQFQAWDMLRGSLCPELGGSPRYLDVLGVNYYPNNQWVLDGPPLHRDHDRYRPLRHLLEDVYGRYGRPMLLSETGAEGEARPGWLRYVADEVRAARGRGVPLKGICLYPAVAYPGWDDSRPCECGLWGFPGPGGERETYGPLVEELVRQQALFERGARPLPAQVGPG